MSGSVVNEWNESLVWGWLAFQTYLNQSVWPGHVREGEGKGGEGRARDGRAREKKRGDNTGRNGEQIRALSSKQATHLAARGRGHVQKVRCQVPPPVGGVVGGCLVPRLGLHLQMVHLAEGEGVCRCVTCRYVMKAKVNTVYSTEAKDMDDQAEKEKIKTPDWVISKWCTWR